LPPKLLTTQRGSRERLCSYTVLFIGLGPKFLGNGSQPFLDVSPSNLHTSLVWGQVLKCTFEIRQSEARRQIKNISFIYDKCAKTVTRGFDATYGEN